MLNAHKNRRQLIRLSVSPCYTLLAKLNIFKQCLDINFHENQTFMRIENIFLKINVFITILCSHTIES